MSWKKVKMGDFLTVREGRLKPSEARSCGLKRVEKIDFSGTIYIGDKTTNTDMITVKKGDLLISGINVEKGAIAIYEGKEDVLATIHYSSYQFDKNKIDIEYLKWFLKSDAFRNLLKENAGGGIKTELKPKHILPLIIDLPSVPLQKEIVLKIQNRISRVEKGNTELQHQSHLITKLRQSILQDAVQGKLVPQNPKDEPASILLEKIKREKQKLISEGKLKREKDLPPISKDEIPFELPKGWVWCRAGDICIKIGSGSTPRGGRDVYKNEGVIFLRSQNIYNEGLDLTSVAFIDDVTHKKMSGTKVISNDILLNITGGSIGRSTLIPANFNEANVSQHVSIIRLIPLLNYKFMHSIILSPYFQNKIMEVQTGGNREGLAKKNMELMLFPLPPFFEQQRIVSKVEELMQLCDELEKEVKNSKLQVEKLMQSVLREAFENKSIKEKATA